jgi:hypothetical protein
MTFYKFYIKSNVKYIYGYDNSIYNINYVNNKLKKCDIKYNLKKEYFTDIKVDVILLFFSIQNIDKLDDFIKNASNILNKKGLIIISFINGYKIYNELKKNNKIEIFHKNEIFWAVYSFNDIKLRKVLFYMRDIIKYDIGIEDSLIYPNILINLFKRYNFNLIKHISFLENNILFKLKKFHKDILKYYELFIFQFK